MHMMLIRSCQAALKSTVQMSSTAQCRASYTSQESDMCSSTSSSGVLHEIITCEGNGSNLTVLSEIVMS